MIEQYLNTVPEQFKPGLEEKWADFVRVAPPEDLELLQEEGYFDDRKGTSYSEFFIRVGRKLIQALDNVTMDGFVFRVVWVISLKRNLAKPDRFVYPASRKPFPDFQYHVGGKK